MIITLALPSKGRLKADTLDLFSRAGLAVEQADDARGYQGTIVGEPDVTVVFSSAAEIARDLARGTIDLGVTGHDLVRETPGANYLEPLRLGYGHADVVVAVPEAWIDVNSMADLDDVAADFRTRTGRRLRVATKYWQLTQGWFADHGIGVYRIVESLGATEGAPAAGSADAIVDITSTGSTLKANALKVLSDGVILKSEACLFRGAGVADDVSRGITNRLEAALRSAVSG